MNGPYHIEVERDGCRRLETEPVKAKKLYNYDGYPIWKNWSLRELTTKMDELVNEAEDAMNEAEEFQKEINHRKKR